MRANAGNQDYVVSLETGTGMLRVDRYTGTWRRTYYVRTRAA